jgi:hypothetical protein
LLLRKGFLGSPRIPRSAPLSMLSLTDMLFLWGGGAKDGWEESSEEQLLARSSLENGEQKGVPLAPPKPLTVRRGSGAGAISSRSSGSDSVWLSSASRSGWEELMSGGLSKGNEVEPPGEWQQSSVE